MRVRLRIWCSGVHLAKKKTTMICQECGDNFVKIGSGLSSWSYYVAIGGALAVPERGAKKRKVGECGEADNY